MVPWNWLTLDEQKIVRYPDEFEIEQAWREVRRLGDPLALHSMTFLTLKPEALRRRLSARLIEYVESQDFEIVGSRPVRFNRLCARAVWRYQWTGATLDRVELMTRILESEDSLMMFLRDLRWEGRLPAAVRLHELKGSSAFTERRQRHHMRSIAQMRNRSLTFVHCPDEPADLLRELAIFFPLEEFREIVAMGLDLGSTGAQQQILDIESTVPEHSVDPEEVLGRTGTCWPPSVLSALENGHSMDLSDAWKAIDAHEVRHELWDVFTLVAEVINQDRTDRRPIVTTRNMPETAEAWRSFDISSAADRTNSEREQGLHG